MRRRHADTSLHLWDAGVYSYISSPPSFNVRRNFAPSPDPNKLPRPHKVVVAEFLVAVVERVVVVVVVVVRVVVVVVVVVGVVVVVVVVVVVLVC